MFSLLQSRDLFRLGQYVSMSIVQGCGGFPFLSEGVYKYLSTGIALGMSVKNEDIMDCTVRFVIKKVCCSVLALLKVIENVLLVGRMVYSSKLANILTQTLHLHMYICGNTHGPLHVAF